MCGGGWAGRMRWVGGRVGGRVGVSCVAEVYGGRRVCAGGGGGVVCGGGVMEGVRWWGEWVSVDEWWCGGWEHVWVWVWRGVWGGGVLSCEVYVRPALIFKPLGSNTFSLYCQNNSF